MMYITKKAHICSYKDDENVTIDVNNRSENAFWEYFLFGTAQPNPPFFV